MFTYQQGTGEWRQNGQLEAVGYSGHPPDVNNPAAQDIIGSGPIPQGFYIISGPPIDDPTCGAYTIRLIPDSGNEMFNRSGFRIHGDEIENAGKELASDGCIILPRVTRVSIWLSGDSILEVIQ